MRTVDMRQGSAVSRETADPWRKPSSGRKSGEVQVLKTEGLEVREARLRDGRSGAALDDHGDGDHLCAGLAGGLHGGQRGTAGGGGVLDDQHPAARDVRALDTALHAVRLLR